MSGFERQGRALVLVNTEDAAAEASVATTLPDGAYCDVVSGGARSAASGTCTGTTVTVDGGTARAEVPAEGVVAVHIGAMRR